MVPVAALPSVALLMLAGCASHDPGATLDVEDRVPSVSPGYVWLPEQPTQVQPPRAEPAVDPGPAPRLRLLSRQRGQDFGCSAQIEGEGLPAVAIDGSHYVHVLAVQHSGADFDGSFSVRWRDVNTDEVQRSVELYDGYDLFEIDESEDRRACGRAHVEIGRRVEAVNTELAAGYRTVVEVPVQLSALPAFGGGLLPVSDDGHARPVEVFFQNGHFIARVRGVEVLQRESRPEWRGKLPQESLDAYEPTVMKLYHDPPTGLGIVELSYESASCMSDPTHHTASLPLEPKVVAKAEQLAAFVRDEADDWENEPER